LFKSLKKILRKNLPEKKYRHLQMLYFRVRARCITSNLASLALAYGTDKEGLHSYCRHYQHHFFKIRKKKLNILEIGIGGYEDPNEGGASLRMWKRYFPKSKIYGIDIYDKSFHDDGRIRTYKGSQIDEVFLKRIVDEIGKIDIVIDDGSHLNEHVISTFKILFPLISKNAIYAIEDLQTSYWTNHANVNWGGSKDLEAPHTSMNFLKTLVDCPNHKDFEIELYQPTYFDQNITSVHFYSKLAFIYKNKGIIL
jgi:hypothetical protein